MAERVKWRLYEEQDADDLVALHLDQEAALGGKPMDLPNMTDRPVMVSLVGEDRDSGEVVGCLYAEAVAEICFVGRDPKMSAAGRREAAAVFAHLKSRGLRIVRLLVPKWMPEEERKAIREELARVGFTETDSEYEHFMYDLR